MQRTPELSYRRFVAYAALAVGVALVPVLLWQLGSILILAFAAALIAILLHVVSERFQRWTPLPVWADLLIAGLIVLALVGVGGWIFGPSCPVSAANFRPRRNSNDAPMTRGRLYSACPPQYKGRP